MSDETAAQASEETGEQTGRKGGARLLLLAALAAIGLGGGAFYGVYAGLVEVPFLSTAAEEAAPGHEAGGGPGHAVAEPAAYVMLEPLLISLGPTANARHLQVTLALEVDPGAEKAVAAVQPRILDVLNEFLRAVDEREFELPRAMARLRAQMLRRVLLVTPPGAVRDLLVQEFVLN